MSEEKQSDDGMSRQDFLQGIGLGLGAAGIASLTSSQAFAAEEKTDRYIVSITHGGNDPNKAILGLRVCPPCAEYMGAVGGDKADFIEKQGADWLMKNIKGATVAWM
jgi:hypothetical protein